jgi:hypothetical protein
MNVRNAWGWLTRAVVVVILTGCAAHQRSGNCSGISNAETSGVVQIRLSGSLSPHRRARFEELAGSAKLAKAMETQLARHGWAGRAKSGSVEVVISEFHPGLGNNVPWSALGRAARPYAIPGDQREASIAGTVTVRNDCGSFVEYVRAEARSPGFDRLAHSFARRAAHGVIR